MAVSMLKLKIKLQSLSKREKKSVQVTEPVKMKKKGGSLYNYHSNITFITLIINITKT